jgi:hypothetical protein
VHVVRGGDTLWDLANFYLSDPFLWPEIYRLNTVVVEDPHWIYPAEELVLPGPGEVVMRPPPGEERVPGDEVVDRVPVPDVDVPPVEAPPQEVPMIEERKTIFAAPELAEMTLVYEPTPPLEGFSVNDGDYYRAAMLLPLSELGPRGEVIDLGIPAAVEVPVVDTPARYERIYVSHPGGDPPSPGDRMLITRREYQIKPFGYVVRPTGIVTIAAVHEQVSTAIVTDLYDRVQVGNQVTRLEYFEMERGVFAEPVGTGPTGELLGVVDDPPVPMVEDLFFVDVGRSQGLVPGDEFEIYLADRESQSGYELPEVHIATGRVVRVTEGTATLRVLEQRYGAIVVGLPVRLVRKMPS